jgi:hypothetical protein
VGDAPRKLLIWPPAIYLPVSAAAVGILALAMRLSVPPSGARGLLEVFLAYALRFPGDFNFARWIAPGLGLVVLLFLSVAIRAARPTVSLIPIRIVLLTLVVVLTILVQILSVAAPLAPSAVGPDGAFEAATPQTAYLFLFVDVDLILVFLATFLPAYRDLKKRVV